MYWCGWLISDANSAVAAAGCLATKQKPRILLSAKVDHLHGGSKIFILPVIGVIIP
jgi:hypothetical protein